MRFDFDTMLQRHGLRTGEHPEVFNLTHPQTVKAIHQAYLEAGSEILYTNTFGASARKLQGTDLSPEVVISAAVSLAREAAAPFGALVALDIGPIGELMSPAGELRFDDAYALFAQQVRAGAQAGADLIAIETMTDLQETRAALLAAKENSDLPVFVTMTFEENKRTFTGCSVSAMCLTMEGLGVDALGVNCSLGPRDLIPIVEEISKWTRLPIIVKPNAGLPDPVTNTYNVLPDEFAEVTKQMLPFGVRILGGCCGTNPDYIRKL